MWHLDVSYLAERVKHVLAGVSTNQQHGDEMEIKLTPLDCELHANVKHGGTLHCGRVKREGECPTTGKYILQHLHVRGKRYSDEC